MYFSRYDYFRWNCDTFRECQFFRVQFWELNFFCFIVSGIYLITSKKDLWLGTVLGVKFFSVIVTCIYLITPKKDLWPSTPYEKFLAMPWNYNPLFADIVERNFPCNIAD